MTGNYRNYSHSFVIEFLLLFFLITIPKSGHSQSSQQNRLTLLDAVNLTLSNNPQIRIQKKVVESSEGSLLRVRGEFDAKLTSEFVHRRETTPVLESQNNGLSELNSNSLSYRIGINKQFRSGFSVDTGIQMDRTEDNLIDHTTRNTAKVNLALEVPLLKARGKKITTAAETAAEISYEISRRNLQFRISEIIFNTVSAYWDYVASWKNLQILKETEDRAYLLVKEAETLIKADELPRADIQQPYANAADKTALRIAAEQNLFEAKQRLGLSIGLDYDSINELSLPEVDFPMIAEPLIANSAKTESFVSQAITQRQDYLAVKESQNYTQVLLDVAMNNLKPLLNVTLDLGYVGFIEGNGATQYFSPIASNVAGLNFSTSISFAWLTGTERGLMLESSALHQQAVIETNDLERKIRSNVVVAMEALRQSILELAQYRQANDLHRKAVENERKRIQLGMSTLIDLIFSEDRLTSTLLNQVSAHQRYAKALAQFRFETGTLLQFENGHILIDNKHLITAPTF